MLVDAFLENFRVGDEQIIANQLYCFAQALSQSLPAIPVAFGHAVLDGDDRILCAPVGIELDQLICIQHLALAFEVVGAILVELAAGHI